MSFPALNDILFWLTRSVHPAVVAVISIFLLASAKAHGNRGWGVLYLGWISNIVYLLFENFATTGGIADSLVSELTSTATGALFLFYALTIRRAEGSSQSPRWAWALATFVLIWSITVRVAAARDPLNESSRAVGAIALLPQVLFMLVAIVASGRVLQESLEASRVNSARLVAWPWIAYGILQPLYLVTLVESKFALVSAMSLTLACKFFISLGLYRAFVEQVRQGQEAQLAGWQSRAFSWFAHELKNPAHAMRSSAQAVMRRLAQREFGRASQDAARLVNTSKVLVNVVESVKIAAEPLRPEKLQFFSVNEKIDEALQEVRAGFIRAPTIAVTKSYASDLMVCADPDSLTQVFVNIFRNTIEASGGESSVDDPEPVLEVTLEIETKGVEVEIGDRVWPGVRCRFVDHGPGIPEEQQEDVFRAYVSHKRGVNRGLGLWVVRSFVEMFGGGVFLKSPVTASNPGVRLDVVLPRVLGAGQPATFWREMKDHQVEGESWRQATRK